ncbi:sodium/proline symporter PutP [Streptomyces sp. MUM 178J]|uniref:sodium/proline symporter PutP n=1 Tax=Streptomyces sp. MUM 178J TaxID=2791991 RepID=UPI001F04FE76|nr:sodium/proline symporter PutP [Streptomyces sp. MUM 178J]WRQ81748.1 sodium/proline symporter PutP [Streptomyces sp. MUM 178J]
MITFAVYLLAMVSVGVLVYQETRTYHDFALGGRRLRAPVAALSAQASDMSGWLMLGLPGAVYAAGVGATWIAVGLAAGTYLNWRFVAPRLRTYTERAGDAVTLSAYLEERFEDRTRLIRIVSATVIVVFFTLYVAGGLVAGGLLFDEIFEVGYEFALTVAAVVIVVYTLLGGFLAVSVTDAVQGTMMFLALLVLPVLGIGALGGFGALGDDLAGKSPELLDMGAQASFADGRWTDGGSLGLIAVISLLAWGLGYFGQPHVLARFMAIRSAEDIPLARRIGVGWVVVTLTGASLVGLLGIALLDEPLANPETVFIGLSVDLLNPWVASLLLAAVLAAIKSTADSQLLVSSTALTEDFYRAFLNRSASDTVLLLVGRITVVTVAVVAYGIALDGGAVLDIVAYAWAGFGAAFGPVIVLSLYWPRMSAAGAMAGMVAGALTVVLWEDIDPLLGPFESGIYEMVPGVIAATIAALVFGRFVGRPPLRTWSGPGGDRMRRGRGALHA